MQYRPGLLGGFRAKTGPGLGNPHPLKIVRNPPGHDPAGLAKDVGGSAKAPGARHGGRGRAPLIAAAPARSA